MKIALLTNVLSPHQMPLAKALVERVGAEAYRYIFTDAPLTERTKMGWGTAAEKWCIQADTPEARAWLENVPVLYVEERWCDLFKRRNERGLTTIYVSERWFKPSLGFLRLMVPSYFRMARLFIRCARESTFFCYPQGVHAARDMARLRGLFRGDLRCLFRAPKVAFESRPGGAVVPLKQAVKAGVLGPEQVAFAKRYGFTQIPKAHWGEVKGQGVYERMRIWGYFVAPGRGEGGHALPIQHPPRVLWVGRMLDLKRVGDLIQACRPDPDLKRGGILLDLYGHGPDEAKLRRLAEGAENIRFHDFVPVEQVRELMRNHDIYVLPSNAYEGWGAVVSEALEEGMWVLASIESGAGATLLPPKNLFHSGDWKTLKSSLVEGPSQENIGEWTADCAAHRLLEVSAGVENEI